MTLAIYVFTGDPVVPRKRPQLLHLPPSTGYRDIDVQNAAFLAKSISEMFGCPAWVADYFQPADTYNIQRRGVLAAARARS